MPININLVNALTLAMSVSPAAAAIKGFNYGANFNDYSVKTQADFEAEFKTAQGLEGTEGFTSARLYTMIQGGTTNTPISAIPAAIKTNTTLLLGLWASGDTFNNEVEALKTAISTYGSELANLIVGISVGSEDLYRNSDMGIKAVRATIAGTAISHAPIGHVDTWTAWYNTSNKDVIDAVDWLGLDAYPYFQNTDSNDVTSGKSLFLDAVNKINSASNGKSLWVTETGWPVSGKQENLAVASVEAAKTYWDEVGCGLLFDKVNTYWYILQDAAKSTPSPSFGIIGSELTTTPLFNLTCPAIVSTSATSSATSTASMGSSTGSVTSSPATTSASEAASSTTGVTSFPAGFTTGVSWTGPSTHTGTSGAAATGTAGTSGTPGSATSPSGTTGTGASGSSATKPAFTGAANTVSASVAGIIAAIFAAVVAF
uniref:Probable glucan endo-1,3-beta-glucosidase eglC n=1 Tax=Talaromyces marneffei PM1 TaxID=1077442 RepID=A0A093XIM5_TALMA